MQHRPQASQSLLPIERAPTYSENGGGSWHAETGDLSDCYKLYFDEARHRIIYQVEGPKNVRIVAVGHRANLGVYREAARRLGRTPGVDAPEK